MAFENIAAFLRFGREGCQFERTFRALSFLLHEWYEYGGSRNPDEAEPPRKMRAIPFDKLVTLTMRLWDAMWAERERIRLGPFGADLELLTDPDGVTFPCPMRERPGKHGPGRAIYDGIGAPEFVTSVLYKLQLDDVVHYFDITPGGDLTDPDKPRVSPTHPDTVVAPSAGITDRKDYLKPFTHREMEIVCALADATKKLTASEIRALGTHENCQRTVEAIRWEFLAIRRHGVKESVRAALNGNTSFANQCQSWLEYADEACSKAHENRSVYERARQLMHVELVDAELRSLFDSVQCSASDIWDDPLLAPLRMVAERSRALARYFIAASRVLEGGSAGKSADHLFLASQVCESLGIVGLPETPSVLSPDGILRPEMRLVLAEKLALIFEEMLRAEHA